MGAERSLRRVPVSRTVLFAACALAAWLVLRVVLWLSVGPREAGLGHAPTVFATGLWFDLAALAYVVGPLLVLGALLRGPRAGSVRAGLRWFVLWLAVFAVLFEAVAEFVFWREFTKRFDFIAVDYLLYTHEVVGNVMSSYPVLPIVAAIAAASALVCALLRRYVTLVPRPITSRQRLAWLVLGLALPLASYLAVDVDQMRRTGNAYADELSGNGVFTLAAAMRRNELDFDRNYVTIPQEEADSVLAQLGVRRAPLSRVRTAVPALDDRSKGAPALARASLTAVPRLLALPKRPRNVVLISVESLSAEYLGVYGNTQGLTPNLDRIARAGLRFDHLFATGTRTVRGLEALSLGTPPVPGEAIVRRPNNDHLSTIGELLENEGYLTYFIYGGYGYFDNMNAFFRGNDYHVVDRTDFPEDTIPFENIWGVADEALFTNATRVFDRAYGQGKPFFANIMTTSNHRPYTYPAGRIDIPPPGGREGAVKYTDYAIGRFIEEARQKPWFDDTLFVIVADHCADVAGKISLPVAKYRIPLIFYAPKLVAPGTYTGIASQLDVPPTLLDMLGIQGAERFFGESLLRASPERAFVSNYQDVGYYKQGLLTVLRPKREVAAYRIDPDTFEATPAPVDPELLRETIAYYQTGARAFRTGALKNPEL